MKRLLILFLIVFSMQLSACGRRETVEYRVLSGSEEADADFDSDSELEADSGGEFSGEFSGDPGQGSNKDYGEETGQEEEPSLFVDVSGEVVNPGVYELPAGNRVFHAIVAAGGFTDEAETRYVNQAEALYDGEKIYICSRAEAEELGGWKVLSMGDVSVSSGKSNAEGVSRAENDGKVNVNQADRSQLMTLPGVGEAKAEAIISYREANGAFARVEDIMRVSGIKEKLFEQIHDKITV